jgi:hypothetical protein
MPCPEINLSFILCWVGLIVGAGMLIFGLMLERRGWAIKLSCPYRRQPTTDGQVALHAKPSFHLN